jgi:hypothetical protein
MYDSHAREAMFSSVQDWSFEILALGSIQGSGWSLVTLCRDDLVSVVLTAPRLLCGKDVRKGSETSDLPCLRPVQGKPASRKATIPTSISRL